MYRVSRIACHGNGVLDCSNRFGCLVKSEDNPAVEMSTLADWEIFRNVWLQDETDPYAPMRACGEADRG